MPNAKRTVARPRGTVRLTLSAKVANNLDLLQTSLKSFAERLGHPLCATGCDIMHLMLERDLAISDRLELNLYAPSARAASVMLPQDPVPARTIHVTIPDKVNNDITALTKAVAVTVGRLGCPACCSGFDILFRREIGTLALDEKANVVRFGGIR